MVLLLTWALDMRQHTCTDAECGRDNGCVWWREFTLQADQVVQCTSCDPAPSAVAGAVTSMADLTMTGGRGLPRFLFHASETIQQES